MDAFVPSNRPGWRHRRRGDFLRVYLSTDEPLEVVRERALAAGATSDSMRGNVGVRAWGERSFYASDPWGNPFCIVQAGSEYTGGAFRRPAPT